MKKSIALAALLIANFAIGQTAGVFESKIQGNKKYALETVTLNNMQMDVPGQEKMTILQEIKGPFTIKTSKATSDGNVPAELTYGDVTIKQSLNGEPQEQKSPVSGTVVSGSFDSAGKFSMQSVKGGDATEELKAMIGKMLDGNLKQINFPKKSIKIGESFEDTTPMNLPMGQLGNVAATIHTTYTLTKIDKGIGYFDTKQVMTMNGTPSGMEMTATGSGTGTLEMNLTEKYMNKLASVMDLDMAIAAQGMSINVKSKATSSTTVAISKI